MARGRGSGRRKQSVADKQAAQAPKLGDPKSMVIRIGASDVGSSVSQLVQDVRHVMEPSTAVRLKERRANKLKDYITMCGPLGVTHLLLFSRSDAGNTNLRICRAPRGPTLSFRVEQYALAKDVLKSMKHPKSGHDEFHVAPLLVMNNFVTSEEQRDTLGDKAPPKHLEKLVTDMFQGLFPPIQPHTTPLHTIKRVLLLNREPPKEGDNGTITISLRHYVITTKITGVPKPIRRLYAAEKLIGSREKKKRALPNLGALDDVADYMLDPSAAGYTSASETEIETDAEVEVSAPVTRRVLSKRDKQRAAEKGSKASHGGRPKVEKRAVKLVELGPRMKLRLTKVEEEVCGGKVMWHEFVTKSKKEEKEMDEIWEKRKKEKEERRRIQKENVERKRKEKAEKGEEGDDDEDEEMEDYDEYDLDDDVWHDEDENEEEHDEEMEDESDDG